MKEERVENESQRKDILRVTNGSESTRVKKESESERRMTQERELLDCI